MGTQFDDLNRHDIQAILDNTAGIIHEVERGSTEYTAEQFQQAQDTQRELSGYLQNVEGPKMSLEPLSDSDFLAGVRTDYGD